MLWVFLAVATTTEIEQKMLSSSISCLFGNYFTFYLAFKSCVFVYVETMGVFSLLFSVGSFNV